MKSLIRRYEEISNNAWPALQTIHYDGWILRFAQGVTKRSNSVNMLYPSTISPDEKIRFCESLYNSTGIAPCFKITDIAEPEEIDNQLQRLGYPVHSTISFQTIHLAGGNFQRYPEVTVENSANDHWLDDFIRMNRFSPGRKPVYNAIMMNVVTPKVPVSVRWQEKTIGVGLGVLEGESLGIFDIVTDPDFRRQGIGRIIVETILAWGMENSATAAYLQVLSDNFAALELYRKLGFSEIYSYWYRMRS